MPNTHPQAASDGSYTTNRRPDFTKRQSYCVPSTLLDAVPQCASSCVETFVIHNYGSATCTDKQSLDFLCTNASGNGFTIGEAGLQCVVSDCTGSDLKQDGVYNICSGVMGSIPETVGTITATVVTTSTFSLPSSIGTPTSIETVSTIVQATGTPTIPVSTNITFQSITTSLATSFPTSTTPLAPTTAIPPSSTVAPFSTSLGPSSPQVTSTVSMSTAVAEPAQQSKIGLTNGQIAGIAVGGLGLALVSVGLAFLFLCCRQKRRMKSRRRSQRYSVSVDSQPTSTGGHPASTMNMTPQTSTLAGLNPNERYYAQAPVEEKRRSFWRKSIKPDEIGVAVSPEVPQGEASPTSLSSQRTTSMLIAPYETKIPARPAFSLWPVPARAEARNRDFKPDWRQTETIPEEEMGTNGLGIQATSQNGQQGSSFGSRPSKRQRVAPLAMNPPTTLNDRGGPPNAFTTRDFTNPPKSARIPLTPTYDNGNFSNDGLQLASLVAPYETKISTSPMYEGQSPATLPQASYQVPTQTKEQIWAARGQGTQPRVRQSSVNGQRPRRLSSLDRRNQARMRSASLHKSIASDSTTFEEDSTPEQENDKELGVAPLFADRKSQMMALGPVEEAEKSPIRDLTYPRMPRPAAVSKQAEKVPRPKVAKRVSFSTAVGGNAVPVQMPSRRDVLVRADQSFIASDSTSPEATPESEIPKFSQRGNMVRASDGLRISNANLANQRRTSQLRAQMMDDVFVDGSEFGKQQLQNRSYQQVSSVTPPPPQARLTPSKTRDGDLYLTVEG